MIKHIFKGKKFYKETHDQRRNVNLSQGLGADLATSRLTCSFIHLPVCLSPFPFVSRFFLYLLHFAVVLRGLPSVVCMTWGPLASGFWVSRINDRCQQETRGWKGVIFGICDLLLPS